MRKQKLVIQLATLTLVGMSAIGLVIVYFFQERTILEMFHGSSSIGFQVLTGIGLGLAAGWCAQKIVDMPFMEPVNLRYSRMIGELHLTWPQIIYVSVCAGVGEEILFRGAVQPFMGIIVTSVIFVAIHGYLNPRDWRISLYGLFMTAVIIVFGWWTREYGIISAVIAHTLIDLYLLTVMKLREKNEERDDPEDVLQELQNAEENQSNSDFDDENSQEHNSNFP